MKFCDINSSLVKELNEFDGLICYENISKAAIINNDIIGFYTVRNIRDYLTVEYNLLNKYRNKGLGNIFVKNILEVICKEYENVSKIYLLIDIDNVKSINVALSNGFSPEINVDEQIITEMPNYRIYSKINEYYKNNKLHKL